MNATDLNYLQGKSVRVTSARDLRNPPAGMRGTIVVDDEGVMLAVDFPQMFRTPVHRKTIRLDQDEIAQLIASEDNGAFSFTIDEELM